MAKRRMRRGEPVPHETAVVVRGLTRTADESQWFSRDDLIDDATTNHDYYGFYGLSVWLVTDEWKLDRILAERMARASKVAKFRAGDLYASGLELWDTGQHPHYDCVFVTAAEASQIVIAYWSPTSRSWTMSTTFRTRARRKVGRMIHIDIVADLNLVDDEGRNLARLPANRGDLVPGAVAVAGRPGFWSWALVDVVDGGFIHFHQITAAEAATHGDLVAVPA